MEVLTVYKELAISAQRNFCSDRLAPHQRLSEEACRNVDDALRLAEEALEANQRNQSTVATIKQRIERIEANQKRLEKARGEEDDLGPLQQEVQRLKAEVVELNRRWTDLPAGEERNSLFAEYAAAHARWDSKSNEWFRRMNAKHSKGFGTVLEQIRWSMRANGHYVLLAAATTIGQPLPDGLSLWHYRLHQIKYRLSTFWDDVQTSDRTPLDVGIELLGVASDVASTALVGTLKVILFLRDRGVRTQEDVGALCDQRETLRKILEYLRLQQRHLEPLLLASDGSH